MRSYDMMMHQSGEEWEMEGRRKGREGSGRREG